MPSSIYSNLGSDFPSWTSATIIYALDTMLPDLKSPTKGKIEAAMQGHVIASAELIGTYQH
jgi:phosphatidylethanolamine-binding protein (PEBP) family uncharacterized protein